MDKIPVSEAVKELTMMLLYLTRFSQGVPFSEAEQLALCERFAIE